MQLFRQRPIRIVVAACSPLLFVACSTVGAASLSPHDSFEHRPRDGDEALTWLLNGNARFVEGRSLNDHRSAVRRASLVESQQPFAVVLGCADSRVIPELVFDHGLGDLFVIRVAGNVVAEDEAGSIEYAVQHLGTPLILVLGHESCGAVTAAVDSAAAELAEEQRLIQRLKPALSGIDAALPRATRIQLGVAANVRQSVRQLEDIAERETGHRNRPELRIVGAVYDLRSGRVRLLEHRNG